MGNPEPIVFLLDDRDEPVHCARCGLTFIRGEKAAWIYNGDNAFVLAHDLCYCSCVAGSSGMPATVNGDCLVCRKPRRGTGSV